MRRSIRWRLQLWYAAVLLAVIAGFAGLLFERVRTARLREVDGELEAAARFLDANLRRFPPPVLDPALPEPPPGTPEWDGWNRPGPPMRHPPVGPSRERLLADLTPPNAGAALPGEAVAGETYYAVWRADGTVLKASPLPGEASAATPSELPPSPDPRLRQRGPYREAMMLGPHRSLILVGKSTTKLQADLHSFAWQLAGLGAFAWVVGLAGGWLISARILRPVTAIAATASAISATNLSERINPETVDRELEQLARVLNATFDRLEAAFERQARFTADASHELRTPLAILRTQAELALSRPRSPEEYRDALGHCLRATNRMTALAEGLLTLARADAGKLDLERRPVDLAQVVAECVGLIRPLAEAKGITLVSDLERVEISGDSSRMAQVVTNLLTNAVQYNRPGGEVRVQLRASAGEAVLAVADTGCGIPEEDRPHIFERFYRVDKARGRASGGHGLGLAICHGVVAAHGGTLEFESEVGRGSTFRVRLPGAVSPPKSPSPSVAGEGC